MLIVFWGETKNFHIHVAVRSLGVFELTSFQYPLFSKFWALSGCKFKKTLQKSSKYQNTVQTNVPTAAVASLGKLLQISVLISTPVALFVAD